MQVPRLLPGLRSAAHQYEAFILDLWGVIHDGHSAFPHSREALHHLKEAGRTVLLLSNAPRRSHALITQMEGFGIPRDLYTMVMSSGEAVNEALRERTDPAFAALGEKCFHLGPERDRSVFEDVNVALVPIAEAEFFVNTGPCDLSETVADYEDTLKACADRGLTMICANPDRLVIRQGKPVVCAGALADRYRDMGGTVVVRGKPDPVIYHRCVEMMGANPFRTAVIGDALETDMAGAAAAGLTGIWVTGGIHARELDAGYGKPAEPNRIAEVCDRAGLAPTAVLPGFIW